MWFRDVGRRVSATVRTATVLAGLSLLTACSKSSAHAPAEPRVASDAGGALDAAGSAETACNGSAKSCDRRYDEVSYAATHDAFAYASGGPVSYTLPNQDLPISAQLTYGIRTLGIRPCPYFGTDPGETNRVYITHNSALKGALGTEPLEDVLGEVKSFLDANPNEVVTLLAESTVTPAQVADTFQAAGLAPYLYTHGARDAGAPWPTLREMIAAGTRLVVFNDSKDADRPAWQHYMWDFIADTDYNITSIDQFTCKFGDPPGRGSIANDLYFINEFIYAELAPGIVVPDKQKAIQANDPTFAFGRAAQCWRETGRIPNFIYVDYFAEGNVKAVVDCLNALPRSVPDAAAACAVPGDAGP